MEDVNERARGGIRLLVGRQAALQLLALTGGIVVARILGPEPLGVFGIAVFVVNLCTIVVDMGMRTALIQHAAQLSERQLTTFFTLQQVLVTVVLLPLLAGAPALTRVYAGSPPELAWLVRLIALDLYVRSWRTLSEIRLERELRYRELTVADLAGSSTYHLVAVVLVLSGFGVKSLGWALVVGNLIRTGWLYRAAPWPIRLAFHGPTARALLRAGGHLQINRIATLVPGWITPTLVGGLLGPQAVGFLVWASTLGWKPLEVLENVVRVALPQFARLQQNLAEVEHVLRRYAALSLYFCGLWFSVLAVAGQDLVRLLYTDQWLPAMPALLVFAGAGMLISVRWLVNAAVIGVGHGRFAAKVSTVAAAIAVIASILLVLRLGIIGVPLGQFLGIALATPWLLRGLRPGAATLVLRASLPILISIAVAILAGGLVLLAPLPSAQRGLVTGAIVSLVYLGVAWAVAAPWLRAAVREEIALPGRWLRRSPTA